MYPKISKVPYISKEKMMEIDRSMVEEFQIELVQMMEITGWQLARFVRDKYFDGNVKEKNILILAGSGGNGGGVMVAARRLHIWGAKITLIVSKPEEELKDITKHQLKSLQKLSVTIQYGVPGSMDTSQYKLIIDGLVGYSLKGEPEGVIKELIEFVNKSGKKVVALDIPSGIDADKGLLYAPYVSADSTLTLALPKTSFQKEDVRENLGELYLADIGVPGDLFVEIGIEETVEFVGGEIFSI